MTGATAQRHDAGSNCVETWQRLYAMENVASGIPCSYPEFPAPIKDYSLFIE